MRYKELIKRYIILAIILLLLWWWLEKGMLNVNNSYDILTGIIGTHGGYGYFLMISSIFVATFLILVDFDIDPFSLPELCLGGRKYLIARNRKTIIFNAIIFSVIYTSIQVIFAIVYVDLEILKKIQFYYIMLLYCITITVIMVFAAVCYYLLYILIGNSYISIFITVVFNMFFSFFIKSDLFYGGLKIVDIMCSLKQVDVYNWLMWTGIDLCIIGLIGLVAGEVYKRKDLLC